MEFLRPVFHADTDAEGEEVVIASESFARSRILKVLSPESYEIAFSEWMDSRRSRMAEKLSEIASIRDNRDRLEQLKRAHSSQSVLPFVGAGMSMPSGYKGWTPFLRHMRSETHVTVVDLEADLAAGEYEQAAQRLFDDSPIVFEEGLQNHFSRSPDAIVGPVLWLPHVFGGCVLTTNFDGVVKRVYDESRNSFGVDVCSDQAAGFSGWLNRGTRVLLRVHGDCEKPGTRVITKAEYDAVYGGGRDEVLARDVLFARCLLFLGCSVARDRLFRAMESVVTRKEDKGVRHYAFLELPSGDVTARRKALAKASIHPIWYPRGSHDDAIEALMMHLAEQI